MAAYTIYQYSAVTAHGEPVQPPARVDQARPFATPTTLENDTIHAVVIPDANCRVLFSKNPSDQAAATDQQVLANVAKGFNVRHGSKLTLTTVAG